MTQLRDDQDDTVVIAAVNAGGVDTAAADAVAADPGLSGSNGGRNNGGQGNGGRSGPRVGTGQHRAGPAPRAGSGFWWTVAGLLIGFVVMLAVTSVIVAASGTSLGYPNALHRGLRIGGAVAVLLLIGLVLRDRPTLRELLTRPFRFWHRPQGGLPAFAAGSLLAMPALGLYAPIIYNDSDSGRLTAGITHVQEFGIDYLLNTQDNLLPHLLLGPAIAVAGLAGAKLAAIVTVQVLAGVIAYIAYGVTKSMPAAAIAAVAALAVHPLLERAAYLPMYPTMLALGYLGCWFAYRSITESSARWRTWVPAGICLAMAPEAHAVGLLFIGVPVLLLIFARSRGSAVRALVGIYGVMLVAMIPRIVINLSVDGLSLLTSYRSDYWVTGGYIREIQVNYWGYAGVTESVGEFLQMLPGRISAIMGQGGGYLLVALALAWLVCCRPRARWFVFVALAYFLTAVTIKRIPPFPRYYSPLYPGIALMMGVAGYWLLARSGRLGNIAGKFSAKIAGRVAAGVGAVGLSVLLVLNMLGYMHFYQGVRRAVDRQPFSKLAAIVDDGKGVLGSRPHGLVDVDADILIWGGQFLTEQEFVTYLSWPSDAAVIDMMHRHNIGWILIADRKRLEIRYHDTWLVPHHGKHARQVEAVAESPRFCLRADIARYQLYQLDCGDSGGTG